MSTVGLMAQPLVSVYYIEFGLGNFLPLIISSLRYYHQPVATG